MFDSFSNVLDAAPRVCGRHSGKIALTLGRIVRDSVQRRIVLSILIVGISSLLVGLSLVYFIGKSTLKRTIGANFEELADVTAKKLDELINHHV